MLSARRAWIAGVAASFFVYLVPLVGPHAVFTVGELLWSDLFPSFEHKALAWRIADWAVALTFQLLLGALCLTVFRARRRAVALVFIVVIPFIVYELNWLLWLKIPERFLIERVDLPDRLPWTEQCGVTDAWLAPLPAMIAAPLNRAGAALVRQGDNGYGVLRVPACTVEPLQMPAGQGSMIDVISMIPSGEAIARDWVTGQNRNRYWIVAAGRAPTPLDWFKEQQSLDTPPILAPDGKMVVWLHRIEGTPPYQTEIRLQSIDGSNERRVPLNKIGAASYVIVAVDPDAEFLIARNLDEFRTVNAEGETRWGPFEPPDVKPQPHTFVRLDNGWFAWDAYREGEPYRIAWSTPSGQGTYLVPRGSGITSAAISADGRYVASSTTTSLNIGSTRDSIVVLKATGAAEVLRKALPPYTRSTVAFLGTDFFAYTDAKDMKSVTHVLRIAPQP